MLVNPPFSVREVIGQVSGREAAGGVVGAIATLAVPNLVKQTGWAGVAVAGLTAFVGGWATSRFLDRSAGKAFVIAGAAVFLIKVIKQLAVNTGVDAQVNPYLQNYYRGLGRERDTEMLGSVSDRVSNDRELFGEEELFGESSSQRAGYDKLTTMEDLEDDVVPTYTGMDE